MLLMNQYLLVHRFCDRISLYNITFFTMSHVIFYCVCGYQHLLNFHHVIVFFTVLLQNLLMIYLGQLLFPWNTFQEYSYFLLNSCFVEQTKYAHSVMIFNVPLFQLSGAKAFQFRQMSLFVAFLHTVPLILPLFEQISNKHLTIWKNQQR